MLAECILAKLGAKSVAELKVVWDYGSVVSCLFEDIRIYELNVDHIGSRHWNTLWQVEVKSKLQGMSIFIGMLPKDFQNMILKL